MSTATERQLRDGIPSSLPGPAALTAFQALKAARLQPGQRVLVHAAAGGVGSAAVQIAKAQGMEVGRSCRTTAYRATAQQAVQQAVQKQLP